MSLPRRVLTFKVNGDFGSRAVGIAAGTFHVDEVDGFLGKLAEIDKESGTVTQAFNTSRIAGIEHLVHAVRLALIANGNRTGFASSLTIELICWAAAEGQIGRAFDKIGVKVGEGGLAILSIGNSDQRVKSTVSKIFRDFALRWDNTLLEPRRGKLSEIKKIFSISQDEIKVAPIQKIVLERVALLALAK